MNTNSQTIKFKGYWNQSIKKKSNVEGSYMIIKKKN